MKLLIKGGKVLDPINNIDDVMDVLITDGKITTVQKNINDNEAEIIDATDKIVCPGFIDLHVHFREPGLEYKEDITSGSEAAAVGGFTTVCCMPNTNPAIDNGSVAVYIKDRADKTGLVNVFPIGSITKGQEGKELSPIAELISAGCVAISEDGHTVASSKIMRNALEYSKMFDLPVMCHCEDKQLSREGQMHEGYFSTIYGLTGIPAEAEDVIVARDIMLSRLTGAKVHFCHVSTKGAVELISQAKEEGLNVTCEVTPHHLILSDEIVGDYDTDTKVSPPLRSQEHIEALIEGIKDGTIDCIATDHAPHHFEGKDCEYDLADFGISGLETAIAVIMDKLVDNNIITITKMVELMAVEPASILGIDKGTLNEGNLADITIIDPELTKDVDTNNFYSKGKNTPFKGSTLKGWPIMTIVNGRIVAHDGVVI
ncbi:Dihydroorotase [Candidatus Syntrophocurvum alkaliphilum]|uniref:Dihydroorotase n=1 Tax=Candidatus Syntrophocurvum alkaliphilum TaxID=2293317 RepID=A0A6I6DBJ9_9FIRM|nr:dihydroorotase [Candidatus Syntrophocurvum alkaliphilum]QGT99669.1 Dihydroorotase [Candidatus Syntrophocurvum alkaliphilum]